MKYKDEINYFMDEGKDVIPTMDMKNFIEFMLASLAEQKKIIYFNDENKRTACLPTNYKKTIENIMYHENWGIEFSRFIDIIKYYGNQQKWENKFATALNEYFKDSNKRYELNFQTDTINIDFTQKEIEDIFANYDEETITIMHHFTYLLSDYMYTRDYELTYNSVQRYKNFCEDKEEGLRINRQRNCIK